MSITSNQFILFLLIALIVYYLAPKKVQWLVLLAASYAYYLLSSVPAAAFLLYSTVITFGGAWWIGRIYQKTGDRKTAKKITKWIMLAAILLDLGMLAYLKYTNFILANLNSLFHSNFSMLDLLLPLGISYYTFQTVGYVLDVYWGRIEPEKNPLKYALFVAFFPQLVQGPIGRYKTLACQLYESHPFSFRRIEFGLERILWGIFKKMLIADWAAVFAEAIFADPDKYAGIAIFGVLLYSAQLYADFSGGIDVMIGAASLFGVQMDENFQRPFFSVSLTDFWRRWHITLGSWMKDYVMYPLTLSKAMNRLGKSAKKVLGKKKGRLIPICIANLIVFLVVGIWHGPTWSNIGWGLYNGVIIAFSSFFAAGYETAKKKLHINDKAAWYRLFMIFRTFAIINISWYFDCADSLGTTLKMMWYSVTRFEPSMFLQISSGKLGTAYTPYALLTLGIGILLLFTVSILQEKGMHIRETLAKRPLALRVAVCLLLLTAIPLFSPMAAARGFIYAQF
ncbi:MAG: MBOAT family protein [Blautia sp.]|nr:MBOAT family protein [Blautia sp.]